MTVSLRICNIYHCRFEPRSSALALWPQSVTLSHI